MGATNAFLVLTSSALQANHMLFIELVSCLSRKLDPALCKRLFPALPVFHTQGMSPDPRRYHASSTALSMYEMCLSRNYLAHAARMLTVASDHVGGYSLTHLLTHSLTHLLTYSPTHSLTYSPTHLTHSPYSFTHSPTHLTHSPYSLTHSLTYSLTYSPTHSLQDRDIPH